MKISELICAITTTAIILFSGNALAKEVLNRSICIKTTKGCIPILDKGSALPTSFSKTFGNAADNQKEVQIKLFIMDAQGKKAEKMVGAFDLQITPAPVGKARLQVTIVVDPSNKLTIYTKDLDSNRTEELFGGIVASADTLPSRQNIILKNASVIGDDGLITETIGIETLGGVFTPIIKIGTKAPHSEVRVFSTATDNLDQITIHLYRGKAKMAKENHLLGSFLLYGIRPAKRGIPKIDVTFTVTAIGDVLLFAKDQNFEKTVGIKRIDSKDR